MVEEEVSVKKIDGTLITIPKNKEAYLISDSRVVPIEEAARVTVREEAAVRAPPLTIVPPVLTEHEKALRPTYHPLSGWSEEDIRKMEETLKEIYKVAKLTPEQKKKLRATLIHIGHTAKEALYHLWEAVHKHKEARAKEKVKEVTG